MLRVLVALVLEVLAMKGARTAQEKTAVQEVRKQVPELEFELGLGLAYRQRPYQAEHLHRLHGM